jgi:hypothetical protein
MTQGFIPWWIPLTLQGDLWDAHCERCDRTLAQVLDRDIARRAAEQHWLEHDRTDAS